MHLQSPGGAQPRTSARPYLPRVFPKCGRHACGPIGRGWRFPIGSNRTAPPPPAALSFGEATRKLITEHSSTPLQQFVGALTEVLRVRCPERKRGKLRSILEATERNPSYAETAVGTSLDLVGISGGDVRGVLRESLEHCAKARRDGPWSDLLSAAALDDSLDDPHMLVIAIEVATDDLPAK